MVQTKGRYHVRVLVPCYRESLEIVARTCQAAWNAKLPAGCDRTIYLCDDGKEASKRKWCALCPAQDQGAAVSFRVLESCGVDVASQQITTAHCFSVLEVQMLW